MQNTEAVLDSVFHVLLYTSEYFLKVAIWLHLFNSHHSVLLAVQLPREKSQAKISHT